MPLEGADCQGWDRRVLPYSSFSNLLSKYFADSFLPPFQVIDYQFQPLSRLLLTLQGWVGREYALQPCASQAKTPPCCSYHEIAGCAATAKFHAAA